MRSAEGRRFQIWVGAGPVTAKTDALQLFDAVEGICGDAISLSRQTTPQANHGSDSSRSRLSVGPKALEHIHMPATPPTPAGQGRIVASTLAHI